MPDYNGWSGRYSEGILYLPYKKRIKRNEIPTVADG